MVTLTKPVAVKKQTDGHKTAPPKRWVYLFDAVEQAEQEVGGKWDSWDSVRAFSL